MYQCPDCGFLFVFVNQHNQWFCNTCGKYPTTVHWNIFNNHYCTAKNFRLGFITFITVLLSFVIFFSFLFGLIITNDTLNELSEENEDDYYYYYSGYDYNSDEERDELGLLFSKGLFMVVYSVILIFCLMGLLGKTIRKQRWWLRLKLSTDAKQYWHLEARRTKRYISMLFFSIYGLTVVMGIILTFVGLNFLFNATNNLIAVAVLEAFLGPAIIFLSFIFYSYDIEYLSMDIFPLVEQPIYGTDKKEIVLLKSN